jgi:hypothetical protein
MLFSHKFGSENFNLKEPINMLFSNIIRQINYNDFVEHKILLLHVAF